ncbi:MAG: sigma-70 family RNA polymerase sigma factor [Candidatus Amulumruptor caecigallinarius]|nr:sigma-70 family RNA polymerase sigma factor [Candidatus Amulumruptor caecigallinarius]
MPYVAPIDEKLLVADLHNPKKAADAFDALIRKYGEQIYWQIRKMVVSHDDANDLLQNCFIKAWNNLHNFRGDAKLSTWLYKIAVNESINFLNKERLRENHSVKAGDEEDDSYLLQNIESDEYFDGDELQVTLQRAIATLPEKQRLVFNMRYFDEMKYEEMSEILGTSVGALKASYHHAVKKIEAAIRDAEIL